MRTEEEWLRDQGMEEEKGSEPEEEEELQFMLETDTEIELQNKKRKQFNVYLEEGIEQPPPKWCSLSVPMNILKYNLKESVACPTNMVSMVCMECYYSSPIHVWNSTAE